MTIGRRIWNRRKELGITREVLAHAVGTSPQTLWKWEKDLTYPDASQLPKLAKALRCTIAFLFNESLLGEDLNPQAILEAVRILRAREEMSLEEVVRAGLILK